MIPNWLNRSESGFAPEGAVIVWGSLTSLSVTEKLASTLDTCESVPSGGSIVKVKASLRSSLSLVPE